MFVVAPSHHAAAFAHHPHGGCNRGRFVITPAMVHCGPNHGNSCNKPSTKSDDSEKKSTTSIKTPTSSGVKKQPTATSTTKPHRIIKEHTPVHHKETNTVATISLDVTGYTVDDLQVQVEDHIVAVEGQRQNRLGDTYVISRRFKLDRDTADEENIQVRLFDGVLDVVVPKKVLKGSRTIPILTSADPSDLLLPVVDEKADEDDGGEEEEEQVQTVYEEDKSAAKDDSVKKEVENDDNKNKNKDTAETNETQGEDKDDAAWEDVQEST